MSIPTELWSIIGATIATLIGALALWHRTRGTEAAKAKLDMAAAQHQRVEGDVSVATVILEWSRRLDAQSESLSAKIDVLEAQIIALHEDIASLREIARILRGHNALLRRQLREAHLVPVPAPDESE